MHRMLMLMLPLLASLMLGTIPARAADPNCMQALAQSANRERQRVGVYVAEIKNVTGNPWAAKAASICSGALARADTYYDRQVAAEDLCEAGSSYVDNQVTHLFRNASSVCHEQFDDLARALPPDQQQTFRRNVERNLRTVK